MVRGDDLFSKGKCKSALFTHNQAKTQANHWAV